MSREWNNSELEEGTPCVTYSVQHVVVSGRTTFAMLGLRRIYMEDWMGQSSEYMRQT
jgi:hypothetical protein